MSISPKRKIFINYRRADEPDFVERIRDWFAWKYGSESVFMDFAAIPSFTPFADFIRKQIHECDVMVAIIGPQWLNLLQERIKRHDEEDYVQLEIRLAIEEGKPIAPIRIKQAAMPHTRELPASLRPMLSYQDAYLEGGRHFLDNIELVMDSMEQELSRLDGLKVINQDIKHTTFDVMDALRSSQEAAEHEDWRTALDWLTRIRQSGYAPIWYPLDDYEAEAHEGLRLQEAARNYNFIRMMAERALKGREERTRVWQALEAFWQKYPGYDPDDLESQFKSVPEKAELSGSVQSTSSTGDDVEETLEPFDLSIFDHMSESDLSAANDLFASGRVAVVAEELPLSAKAITFAEAQALGLIDDLENANRKP